MYSCSRSAVLIAGAALAFVFCGTGTARAAVEAAEAAKLGAELTPVGAERAANADGSIPAWNGDGLQAPAGWTVGQVRPDPYANEQPLFSIDAGNAAEHSQHLSAGQLALLQDIKGYRMDVYPTHRDCGYPEVVYARTKQNATAARMAANGWALEEAVPSGFPFPLPQSGAEAIWNHKLRWSGAGRIETYSTIFSEPSGRAFMPLVQKQWTLTPFGNDAATSLGEGNGIELKLLNEVVSPAARVGELILVHYFLNKPNEAWLYFPGQRRVRRSPTFAYDNPVPGYENLLMVDQYPMYSGPIDRYDFKLVGKQELYVAYNTFRFNDTSLKFKDIMGPDSPRRDLIRYEKHRVWKIEASVKPGMRHLFPKREFYLDEDTWAMLQADLYDAQGKVWRVMESYPYTAWELGACVYQGYTSYDLNVGRYMADNMPQEGKVDWLAGKEGRIDPKRFDANQLRRVGSR